MSSMGWGRIMDLALDRHADAPDVDQVCAIVHELHPGKWTGTALGLLRLVAAFELGETMKRVAFVREGARASGLDPAFSFHELRAIFGKTVYRRARFPEMPGGDNLAGELREQSRRTVPDPRKCRAVLDVAAPL